MRRLLLGIAPVLACLAFVPVASAHNVSVSPRAGVPNTQFAFKGTQWQANRFVRWYYYPNVNGSPTQTSRFKTNRSGNFRFLWTDPNPGIHALCFKQFDTRNSREYFKCRRYEVFGTD